MTTAIIIGGIMAALLAAKKKGVSGVGTTGVGATKTNKNFWKLVGLLNKTGWYYVYMTESKVRKDSTTTYYLVPYYFDAVPEEEMIDLLNSEFDKDTSYLYRVEDINDIWHNRHNMLEITLLNK